jgi:hypothetical protein
MSSTRIKIDGAHMGEIINAYTILGIKYEEYVLCRIPIDGRLILKWILEKYCVFVWTEFNCLFYNSVAGLCKDSNESLIS